MKKSYLQKLAQRAILATENEVEIGTMDAAADLVEAVLLTIEMDARQGRVPARQWLRMAAAHAGIEERYCERDQYAIAGDMQAARAGDWGWLPIDEDSAPACHIDVLIAYQPDDDGTILDEVQATVGYGDLASNRYLAADLGPIGNAVIARPLAWMPIPGMESLKRLPAWQEPGDED